MKEVDAIQPFRFCWYNQGMGSVDLLYRFASQCRPQLKCSTGPYF